jgi:AraC-like DNA-binding protein
MYRERRSRVAHSVVWQRLTGTGDLRIDPDGCLDVIWDTDGRLIVAGPDTGPHVHRGEPGRRLVGIRLGSGIGPLVLGVLARELIDQRVPLDALWPAADVRHLAERVAASPAPGTVLEAAAAERLAHVGGPDPMTAEVVRLLRLGRGVRAIADVVGLSERQLHRRSLDAFGYGPKVLGRILRLQEAIRLARSGAALADSAAAAGFADQAHLSREARSLTGQPPTRLVGRSQAPAGRLAKRSMVLPSGSWRTA